MFWSREVGPDTPNGADPEQLLAQGHETAHWEVSKTEEGGELGMSSAGGSNEGGRLQGDQGIHHKEAEYGHEIYCDLTYSGPVNDLFQGQELGCLGSGERRRDLAIKM